MSGLVFWREQCSLSVIEIPFEQHQVALLQLFEQVWSNRRHILISVLRSPKPSNLVLLCLTYGRVEWNGQLETAFSQV